MKFADLVLTARQSRRSWRIISHWEIYEKRFDLPKFYIFCHRFQLFLRKNVSCVLNADSRWQHIAFYPGLPHIIKFQKETKHSPFTRNSTLRPNYLLEYMDSSHINQSYFTWHTLTNEFGFTVKSGINFPLTINKRDNGKSGDKASRKEEYIPTMGCAPGDAALCRLHKKWRRLIHDYVSAAVTTISLHRFIIFPSFSPLAFAFMLRFVRKTLLKEKDSICRRPVCQMQPDIPCSHIGTHLGTISFDLFLLGHKTPN